jgi:hypothetical protein
MTREKVGTKESQKGGAFVENLLILMASKAPFKHMFQRRQLIQIIYCFEDASGKDFDSCILIDGNVQH